MANQPRTSGAGPMSTSDLVNVLQCWYQDSLPTLSQLQNLIQRLRPFFPDLPSDRRTLLKTPTTSTIIQIPGGECVHFDMRQSLTHFVENNFYAKLHLQFSIDGLSIFDSSPCSLWPIHRGSKPPCWPQVCPMFTPWDPWGMWGQVGANLGPTP